MGPYMALGPYTNAGHHVLTQGLYMGPGLYGRSIFMSTRFAILAAEGPLIASRVRAGSGHASRMLLGPGPDAGPIFYIVFHTFHVKSPIFYIVFYTFYMNIYDFTRFLKIIYTTLHYFYVCLYGFIRCLKLFTRFYMMCEAFYELLHVI